MNQYPDRDLVGYGPKPPNPDWPGGARLAINFALNYEEGAEYCVPNGDEHSETALSDLSALEPLHGARQLNIESCYEYGSRVGVWRIFDAFADRDLPLTVYDVGAALEMNPAVAEVIRANDYDVVSRAWRWIDYQFVPEEVDREHIRLCVETIERLTGTRPLGCYTDRPSLNTRCLVVEEGGFLYDCDAYNDDLPYWVMVNGKPHLVICHSLDTDDSRFTRAQGFDLADDWFT
jgi:peptidoglycan/xylan/chitin deacetylase (PgdA/CDA1 family)